MGRYSTGPGRASRVRAHAQSSHEWTRHAYKIYTNDTVHIHVSGRGFSLFDVVGEPRIGEAACPEGATVAVSRSRSTATAGTAALFLAVVFKGLPGGKVVAVHLRRGLGVMAGLLRETVMA